MAIPTVASPKERQCNRRPVRSSRERGGPAYYVWLKIAVWSPVDTTRVIS
jgi:hypothetical protein